MFFDITSAVYAITGTIFVSIVPLTFTILMLWMMTKIVKAAGRSVFKK